MRRDQYGEPIPEDLGVISGELFHRWLDEDTFSELFFKDWYECEGFILVDDKFIHVAYIGLVKPSDYGLDLQGARILKIDKCLKRWSKKKGFYYAKPWGKEGLCAEIGTAERSLKNLEAYMLGLPSTI